MTEIIIIGSSGHAKVVYDIILSQKLYKPVAFVSSNERLSNFMGLPHIHQSQLHRQSFDFGIVAIGDNYTRSKMVEFVYAARQQFQFVSVISPSAVIAPDVCIGEGTVIMPNVSVNTGSQVGNHVILNTGVNIDHDNEIGDFASIAPGCNLGGNVSIGKYTAISLGTNIIHSIAVGEHSLIGAGSLLLKNFGAFQVGYGIPCKMIRTRIAGEKYL